MEVSTASYLTTVVIGVAVALVVGQLLRRIGFDFLVEVYGDQSTARALNHLLVTLFHLIALGLICLASTANPRGLNGIQLVITRTGIVLLVLGGVYGLTVLALTRARHRLREEALEDDVTARYQRRRGP